MPRTFLNASVPPKFAEAVHSLAKTRMVPISVLIRQALAEMLREEGYDVEQLWSPRQGLRHALEVAKIAESARGDL
jgi:hypothetical protein